MTGRISKIDNTEFASLCGQAQELEQTTAKLRAKLSEAESLVRTAMMIYGDLLRHVKGEHTISEARILIAEAFMLIAENWRLGVFHLLKGDEDCETNS